MKRELRKKFGIPSEQELKKLGKIAKDELNHLLIENPQIKEFQKEIERQLENAGNYTNRMAVLGTSFKWLTVERQNGRMYLVRYNTT